MTIKLPFLYGLIYFCFQITVFSTQAQEITPVQSTYPTGLGGKITCLAQDKAGFIWIGKESGLLRYDGSQLKSFQHDPANSASISNNYIRVLYADSSGDVWIGTQGGLNRYDHKTGKFTRYIHRTDDKSSISYNEVHVICPDGKGNFLIGTDGGGLNFFNPVKGTFRSYQVGGKKSERLKSNSILAIVPDGKGKFWLGTWAAGLYLFDPKTELFKPAGEGTRFSKLNIFCLKEVRPGILWIGTFVDDLLAYDIKNKSFTTVMPKWKQNAFTDIEVNKKGKIYVAAWGGLFCFETPNSNPKTIRHTSAAFNSIQQLLLDNTNTLWVSNVHSSLGKINSFQKKFHTLNTTLPFAKSPIYSMVIPPASSEAYFRLSNQMVVYNIATGNYSVFPTPYKFTSTVINVSDKNSLLYSGIQGLHLFNRSTKNTSNFVPKDNQIDITKEIFRSLYNAGSLGIWAGGAPDVYQIKPVPGTNTWNVVKKIRPGIDYGFTKSHHTNCFLTADNDLWVGTWGGGLNRLQKGTTRFTHLKHIATNNNSISDDFIECMAADKNGDIWVGTQSGLNKYHRKTGKFTRLKVADGLINDHVTNIVIDSKNRAWITTGSGLSRVSNDLKVIRNYDTSDGLPSNEFHPRSAASDSKGNMYFGSTTGLVWFHPDSIYDNPFPSTPTVTNFLVNKEGITNSLDFPLIENIENTKEIWLNSEQNTFSFQLTALSYFNNQRNKLKYRLDGYDTDWHQAGINQTVNYTDISSGTYTLLVAAANEDGVWNPKLKQIIIIISRPWFLTNLALLLYFMVSTGLFFYLYRLRKTYLVSQEIAIYNSEPQPDLIQPSMVETTPANLIYLQKAIAIVEENISDFDFGVQQLCEKLCQSQRQVNRKVHEVAGVTISEFIKEIRLKRAAQLLANKSANVSEVAYQVGFNNPKYFSRCFKQYFNMSPAQYANSNANDLDES